MKLKNFFSGVAILATASSIANASTQIIEFNEMSSAAYYGKANEANMCTGFTTCYTETGADEYYIGTTNDLAAGPFTHLHRAADGQSLQHHADAAGIYGRRIDEGTFNFNSFDATHITGDNTGIFQIIAFSEAYNADIIGNGVDYTAAAGYLGQQTINNSDVGTVSLDQALFANIKAFWIVYDGYNYTPSDGTAWDITVDNINVSTVPVPAAAYLFGTGLIGLISLGRKKTA